MRKAENLGIGRAGMTELLGAPMAEAGYSPISLKNARLIEGRCAD
ncbi:hypothetical protein [Rhodovulum strictum]|nr:hypothetical protein [Rhodovulum strictum]